MASIERLTDLMSSIVTTIAEEQLAEADRFRYEVFVGPSMQRADDPDDEDEPIAWYPEIMAGAVLLLEDADSEHLSVMYLATPLRNFTQENFRRNVDRAVTEMRFGQIAAAEDDPEWQRIIESSDPEQL